MVRFRRGLRAVLLMAMIMGLPWFQVAWADLNDGLVAYYPFDGNTQDASGNGNHGTVKGTLDFEDGVFFQAARFEGNSHVIVDNTNNIPLGSSSRTLSAWIMMTEGRNNTDDQPFVGYGQTENSQMFAIAYGLGNSYNYGLWLYGCTNDLSCVAGGKPNQIPSEFYHVVATYHHETNTAKLFVNGEMLGMKRVVISTPETSIYMGGLYTPSFGLLDEVRLYNRALSESEIQQLYNGKAQTDCNEHAFYSIEKNKSKLIIPYINVPLLDTNYQTTGQFALFEGEFTQNNSTLPSFSLVPNRFKSVFLIPSNEACYAVYSFKDRTLHIPFVDVDANVYEVTLRHLQEVPLDLGIFRLESYNLLYTR